MQRYAPAKRPPIKHGEPQHGFVEESWEWKRETEGVNNKEDVQTKRALRCPEDVRQSIKCQSDHKRRLCRHTSIPLCLECNLQYRIPAALTNDNYQGYAHPFIVEIHVLNPCQLEWSKRSATKIQKWIGMGGMDRCIFNGNTVGMNIVKQISSQKAHPGLFNWWARCLSPVCSRCPHWFQFNYIDLQPGASELCDRFSPEVFL